VAVLDSDGESLAPHRGRILALAGGLFGLASLFVVACQPVTDLTQSVCTLFCEKYDYPVPLPGHATRWLTKTVTTGSAPANAGAEYYAAIDPTNARDTLDKWKAANGFGQGDEVVTYYFNGGDLDYGREMHCRQAVGGPFTLPGTVSTFCYVTNYGSDVNPAASFLSPAVPPDLAGLEASVKRALDRAVAHDPTQAFATVAMESYQSGIFSILANNVRFYVFNTQGVRQTTAALDSEGAKAVPVMCMACHGGSYDYAAHAVHSASFLPFDLHSFRFSTTTGFTRADQEENFRQQNRMVRDAGTTSDGIVRLINHFYPHGVVNVGQIAADDFPPGWSGENHDSLYRQVVAQYCRSCHSALTPVAPQYEWNTYAQFQAAAGLIAADVCGAHAMPHAEIPFYKFWQLDAVQRGPEVLQQWLVAEGLTCPLPTPQPTPTATP